MKAVEEIIKKNKVLVEPLLQRIDLRELSNLFLIRDLAREVETLLRKKEEINIEFLQEYPEILSIILRSNNLKQYQRDIIEGYLILYIYYRETDQKIAKDIKDKLDFLLEEFEKENYF
jgi:hypothetical protein